MDFSEILKSIKVDNEEYERRERAEQLERERDLIASRLEQIPKRYINATFSNNELANNKLVDYLKQGKSIIIHGSNGTGKTYLAFATIRHLIEKGLDAKYILAFDFFDKVKRSFGTGDTSRLITKYIACDYLVIDEVDKSYGSQAEFLYLYKLINDRYNEMRPTMLISNADTSSLKAVIGASVFDRVAGDGVVYELKDESRRKGR